MYRQGDVLIIPTTNTKPADATKVKRDRGRIVLAYGEVTGHAHAIADKDATLYHDPTLEDRFLRVLAAGGVDLRHEEHGTIHLPAGDYIVRRQTEYTPEAIRQVAD